MRRIVLLREDGKLLSKAESKKNTLLFLFLICCLVLPLFSGLDFASANSVLGNSSIITSGSLGSTTDMIYLFGPFTAATTGYINEVSAYIYSEGANTGVAGAVYADSAGAPSTLLGASSTFRVTENNWVNFPLSSSCQVTAASSYWLAVFFDGAYGASFKLGYQLTGGTTSQYTVYAGSFFSPMTGGTVSNNRQVSIYATVLSDPFTASSFSANIKVGANTSYTAEWITNETLSQWQVQTNQTGTITTSAWQSFSGSTWSNYTGAAIPLNGTWAGWTVQWQIWAKTTLGYISTTGAQYTTILPSNYLYTFNGVYDENTGTPIGSCNVTVNFDDGTPPYSFILNGTNHYYYPNSKPLYFEYNIQPLANTTDTTITRQYWLRPDEVTGVYNVFGNQIGLLHIIFQIRALGGVGLSSFLEVQRLINGTYQTVEQRQIDATGITTMSLQPYTIYRILAWSGDVSTTFNNINTYTSQITLTISALSFPNNVLMQYKYLRIWASRPSSTEIQISYEDTNLQTTSVSYQLTFANGTVAYSATHTGENSFVDIWSSADSNTTYYLSANVSQTTFGYSTFAQVLLRDGASTSPIDLSFLGDWPIDPTQIFWAFIVFIVFGVGSALNAYIGGFAGVTTAAILMWLGWLVIPAGGIVAAFCVVFMVGIVYWKRRS